MMRHLTIVTLLCACSGGSGNPAQPADPIPSPEPPAPAPSSDPVPSPAPLSDPTPSSPPSAPPAPQPSQPPTPSQPPQPTVRAHNGHAHCGWIGADTAEAGVASFMANADWFDAIHPKWFTLNSDGTPRTIAFTDDARVISTAHAHGVKLIPLIDADSGDYVLAAAKNPAAHAQALLALVTSHGYDGIELDYEHLWDASDRAPYTALIQAVAAAMHANGKVLTLALPALWQDNHNNGYDYAVLQQNADTLHLMGYDYHWLGGPHLGPIAPKGWIDNVGAYVQSLGAPQKYSLGVANYGIGNGWYTTGADAVGQCGASYSRETDHMLTCSLGNHEAAGLAPHCTTQKGDVWFEDSASIAEKAASAKAHGLGGMTYWTVGAEVPGFFDAVTAQYQ